MPPKKPVAAKKVSPAPSVPAKVASKAPAAKVVESEESEEDSPVDTDGTEDETEDDSNEEDDSESSEEDEEGSEEEGSEESDDGFEQQSSDDESVGNGSDESEDEEQLNKAEAEARKWSRAVGNARSSLIAKEKETGDLQLQQLMHNDDLSSDDEDAEGNNTIGRVPLHWYDAYDHIGYTVSGGKVVKRKGHDKIDLALLEKDDPNGERTIYDMYNDREVTLSARDLEIIRRIQSGAYAHPEFNDTPEYSDYYSGTVMDMPLSAAPEPKRRFVPSKWELMKVAKIVKAMKEGRYKAKEDKDDEKDKQKKGPFLIWNDAEDEVLAESRKNQFHLPAPKMPLPGHAESYNPPAEYLLDDQEKEKLLDMDPEDRPNNFLPEKYDCLRHVPGYENFVKERFERCLDLYLCPRKLKKRLNIDPETLVPQLPKPKELKPYPNTLCLQFLGHKGAVRSISVSPDGQYLVSGSEDGTVRLWEVDTCLVRYTWDLKSGPVSHVSWNPDANHHFVSAVVGSKVVLIATGTGDADSTEITESHLSAIEELVLNPESQQTSFAPAGDDDEDSEGEDGGKQNRAKPTAKWTFSQEYEAARAKPKKGSTAAAAGEIRKHGAVVGPRFELNVKEEVTSLAWHYKGDYLAVVAPSAGAAAVSVHQVRHFQLQTLIFISMFL